MLKILGFACLSYIHLSRRRHSTSMRTFQRSNLLSAQISATPEMERMLRRRAERTYCSTGSDSYRRLG